MNAAMLLESEQLKKANTEIAAKIEQVETERMRQAAEGREQVDSLSK